MSNLHTPVALAKYNKRELDSFLANEFLYDYINNNLDPERKKAVEHYLQYSRDGQLELEKIKAGMAYASKLSQTQVSEELLQKLKQPNSHIYVLLQKLNYHTWPVGFKWGVESLVVIAFIAVIMTVVPWNKLIELGMGSPGAQVVIAEVRREESAAINVEDEKGQFIDEDLATDPAEAGAASAKNIEAIEETIKPSVASSAKETGKKTASVANASKGKTPTTEESPASDSRSIVANAKKTSLPPGVPAVAGGGYLYRGSLVVKGLDANGVKIREKIENLGGRKAGDVELGWKKTATSEYYHFTLPGAKYAELMSYVAPFGKLTLRREKHPRVMPEGIVRLIITVEESDQ